MILSDIFKGESDNIIMIHEMIILDELWETENRLNCNKSDKIILI